MSYDWDKRAKEWEMEPATIRYAEKAFEELENIINVTNLRVFDFGCGTGLLSQKIAPLAKDIVALDSSEAMIEELDKKFLPNVEPVVDILSRGLIAQHPAFRGQFDCVIASSVCGFIENFQEAAELIYLLLEDEGIFVHWDWLAENEQKGLTEAKVEQVLIDAGFDTVSVSVPFEVETEQGTLSVIMGIGEK
ncbi:class I SAM-dependent DNA methyltransferase [Vibrio algarum]|uniref:Class I SAM-dependent methyltransferase n=1 Tax=Vibrio algarum TaxID=3020714 RepID=A0ABT4YVW8_9VIBR|nr:class I SAM-dependent methyltransferase [Vibrio sp. KJ40-1]MDB1125537.1 class I SAM-dependent methyltransferase [Vibrio sp. KJ40-1]